MPRMIPQWIQISGGYTGGRSWWRQLRLRQQHGHAICRCGGRCIQPVAHYRSLCSLSSSYALKPKAAVATMNSTVTALCNWRTAVSRTATTTTNTPPLGVDDRGRFSGGTSSITAPNSFFNAEQREVMDRCRQLHSSIMPLNEKLRGPLAPQSDRGTSLPFVLLVGNHSSGKSSFLNYVLGRNIQTAGVAPTDDSFTIVAPGPEDRDQDGPALVGDPDLGFSQLRQFGPTLMHHTQLKIRANTSSNFIMVDSPGMIDSPGSTSGMLWQNKDAQLMDRGYDFAGVVRWLADRADVVCLFFDPDKPGTTGETLKILLHSLSGMDHKLLIVLNKADQFERIHDFARAYGSLCWNLSKVIPRKDLPRIYTMCLPVAENDMKPVPASLQDLHTARDEVVQEVRKAPARRMDNVITNLFDSVHQLLMHGKILMDLRRRWSTIYWHSKWQELGIAVAGGGLTALLSVYGNGAIPMEVTGVVLASTMVATTGMVWYDGGRLREWERQASTPEELGAAFQRAYSREISEGDEFVAAIWQRVRTNLRNTLMQQSSMGQLPLVSTSDLASLQSIVDQEIPKLRRLVAPGHYK